MPFLVDLFHTRFAKETLPMQDKITAAKKGGNPFLLFYHEIKPSLREKFPSFSGIMITKEASKLFRELPRVEFEVVIHF